MDFLIKMAETLDADKCREEMDVEDKKCTKAQASLVNQKPAHFVSR